MGLAVLTVRLEEGLLVRFVEVNFGETVDVDVTLCQTLGRRVDSFVSFTGFLYGDLLEDMTTLWVERRGFVVVGCEVGVVITVVGVALVVVLLSMVTERVVGRLVAVVDVHVRLVLLGGGLKGDFLTVFKLLNLELLFFFVTAFSCL